MVEVLFCTDILDERGNVIVTDFEGKALLEYDPSGDDFYIIGLYVNDVDILQKDHSFYQIATVIKTKLENDDRFMEQVYESA